MGAKWIKQRARAEPSIRARLHLCPGTPLHHGNSWNPEASATYGSGRPSNDIICSLCGSRRWRVLVRDNGSYTLLQVVTRKGSRLALDSDVLPTVSDSGENTLALTEEAVKHGALRLELRRAYYNNAEMHAYLGNLIYQNQSLMDLVRPALWGGLVMFFAGLLPATYLDRKHLSALRHEGRPRGPELTTGEHLIPRQRSLAWASSTHFTRCWAECCISTRKSTFR